MLRENEIQILFIAPNKASTSEKASESKDKCQAHYHTDVIYAKTEEEARESTDAFSKR